MIKQFKDKSELFYYLMHGYMYMLEEVPTKNGVQKRLRDNELEVNLKKQIKEQINAEGLGVELKLGPAYNRTEEPWIQLFTAENKSGTRGRYIGISFNRETNEIELWIGYGKKGKRQSEILEQTKEYILKYSLIEPELKNGFEYSQECYEAIVVIKLISIKEFNDDKFNEDLKYIINLYKEYETRFEKSTANIVDNNKISYEELNDKMMHLIEEVGELAKAIRELNKD